MFTIKSLSALFSKCHLTSKCTPYKNFTSIQGPIAPGKLQTLQESVLKKPVKESNLLQRIKSAPCYNLVAMRTIVRNHYYPRALKRMNKFGLEKRLSKKSQRIILLKKYIRGRDTLSAFDRFTNQLPGQPYRLSKRINLFDRRIGFKKPLKHGVLYKL